MTAINSQIASRSAAGVYLTKFGQMTICRNAVSNNLAILLTIFGACIW